MHPDELTGMHVQQPETDRLEPQPGQEPERVEGAQSPSEERPGLPPGIKAEIFTAEPGEVEPLEEGWFNRYRRLIEGRAKRLVLRKQGGAGRLPQSVARSKSTGLGAVNVRDQGTLLPHEAGVDIGASDNRWDDGWFNRVISKVLGVGTPNPTPRVCHIRSRKDDSYQVRLEGYLNKTLGIELFEQPASSGAFIQRATWFAIGSTVYFRVNDGSDVTRFSVTSLGTDIAAGNLYIGSVQIIDSSRNADFTSLKIGGTERISSSGNFTGGSFSGTTVSGTIADFSTGYRKSGAAASGQYIRGDGTNGVFSAIQIGDLPAAVVRDDEANTWSTGAQDFTNSNVQLKVKRFSDLGAALDATNFPAVSKEFGFVWDGSNFWAIYHDGTNKWKWQGTQVV